MNRVQFKVPFRIGFRLCFIIIIIIMFSCKKTIHPKLTEQDVVLAWVNLSLDITKLTPANSPTFASRAFGYIGLVMYESIVNGYPNYVSMQGQLNNLNELPKSENDSLYDWVIVLNAAQASILKNIYVQTSDDNKLRIDSLEKVIYKQYALSLDDEIAKKSNDYGVAVAEAIFEWSKTDGGHRGYLQNFDKKMTYPKRPGGWKPPLFAQSFSHHPLHPHWGENRSFVLKNSELPLPKNVPYDTVPESQYYQEFFEVYKKEQVLTKEEKEAAIWWGDDPDVTFTPPGHSYYFGGLAVDAKQSSLIKSAEVFAKVGMATADAFIHCWKLKYYFFTERANTFVPNYIDEQWESFWPDPPFPAFPSGHAIQAAAAAAVLENCFGKEFKFIDKAHEGRARDEVRDTDFVIRSFDSFWEAALETADSRFYGGIHTYSDNKVGLDEGVKVAKNINDLQWRIKQ